ncbi:MAG: glycosyltransferase family 2 protein [Bacteroidales bacterium]|jgi:glycosyltransferase involved in cell wall biosynthesis|nr:glycosyltransferase family 2 protein [Bacteroidales bacterium]MDY0197791.1 glycosyltransferase family 2 protein [Tenuifilaceae bacterium]
MNKHLTLSIVVANFNNQKYLDTFFESIDKSSQKPDELVFVDDKSTDNSLLLAKKWKKKANYKFVLIALDSNQGFANALNIGIKKSTGDLILRIDPDDFFHPHRIMVEKEYLTNNPDIHIVGSNTYYFNSHRARVVGHSFSPVLHNEILKRFQKGVISIANTSYTARREVFDKVIYEQDFVPYEEYVIFSKMLSSSFKTHNISQPLTYYRVHSQIRSYRFIKNKLQDISDQCYAIWGNKISSFTLSMRTIDSYLYWRWLRSNNLLFQLFWMALGIPFKAINYLQYNLSSSSLANKRLATSKSE